MLRVILILTLFLSGTTAFADGILSRFLRKPQKLGCYQLFVPESPNLPPNKTHLLSAEEIIREYESQFPPANTESFGATGRFETVTEVAVAKPNEAIEEMNKFSVPLSEDALANIQEDTYIFAVVDKSIVGGKQREFRLSTQPNGIAFHERITGGLKVWSAGEITIKRDIVTIDGKEIVGFKLRLKNKSSVYEPLPETLHHALDIIATLDIPIISIIIEGCRIVTGNVLGVCHRVEIDGH